MSMSMSMSMPMSMSMSMETSYSFVRKSFLEMGLGCSEFDGVERISEEVMQCFFER